MHLDRRILLQALSLSALAAGLNACGGGGSSGGGTGGGGGSSSSSSSSSSSGPPLTFTAGAEFTVKTQVSNGLSHGSPVGLTNGTLVTSWSDRTSSETDVRARIYTAAGVTVGTEILVNTQTNDTQLEPEAAALTGGGFVIVWNDFYALGSGGPTSPAPFIPADSSGGVRAQVFDSAGNKIAGEIRVNTRLDGRQSYARVAGLTNGGFVVTWVDSYGDLNDDAIKAQIFGPTGAFVGTEFLVNTNTASFQTAPSVAGLTGGGFVILWHDDSKTLGDTSRISIKGQIYDAAGTPVGGEFLANSTTAELQWFPVVAGLLNGGFVAAWEDTSLRGGDASVGAIKAQVFTASGAKSGVEFLVNTNTANNQSRPGIAVLPSGHFVISWQDNSQTLGDTAISIIKAQAFVADGTKSGSEFLVNTPSPDPKVYPRIATVGNGFAVAWKTWSGILLDPSSVERIQVRLFTPV